jgi:hypothetical protein
LNEIVAYALLILGAPIAIGSLVSFLFVWLPHPLSEAFEGILNTLVAIGMFHILKVGVSLLVPLAVAIISASWLSHRREHKAIPFQILGIIIAFTGYYLVMSH